VVFSYIFYSVDYAYGRVVGRRMVVQRVRIAVEWFMYIYTPSLHLIIICLLPHTVNKGEYIT